MFQIFLCIVYFLNVQSWHYFRSFPHIHRNNQIMITMNHYEYGKEYFDFYNKFKIATLQNNIQIRPLTFTDVNENTIDEPSFYDLFVEKNIESYNLFKKNWKKIQETNVFLQNQNSSLVLDLNTYADIIDFDDEYTLTDLMINPIQKQDLNPLPYIKVIQDPIPYIDNTLNKNKITRINWNDTGLLSPVKNQGRCGSCWAFSATSALETFMRNRGFDIKRLSEQELVNCSPKDYGCNGGMMHTAFDYVIKNKGLYSEEYYPYVEKTQNCSKPPWIMKAAGSQLKKYKYTIPKSVIDMKLSLLENPIAIALDADNIYFRFYKDGVIDLPINTTKTLSHAVLLVGFDQDEQGEYWIIQNSWGEKWGQNGFCKIRIRPNEGVLLSQMYGVYPSD